MGNGFLELQKRRLYSRYDVRFGLDEQGRFTVALYRPATGQFLTQASGASHEQALIATLVNRLAGEP